MDTQQPSNEKDARVSGQSGQDFDQIDNQQLDYYEAAPSDLDLTRLQEPVQTSHLEAVPEIVTVRKLSGGDSQPESQDMHPGGNPLFDAIMQRSGLNHPATAKNARANNHRTAAFGFMNVPEESKFEESMPNETPIERE